MNYRYKVSFALLALSFILPGSAVADSKNYVSLQFGAAIPNNKIAFEAVDKVAPPAVTQERFKNSILFDAAVGRKVYDNVSVEMEVAYAPKYKFNKIEKTGALDPHDSFFATKVRSASAFGNINYQFKGLHHAIVPFFLAGAGYSSNKMDSITIRTPGLDVPGTPFTEKVNGRTTSNFAWQVGCGILLPVLHNVDLSLSYRYRDLGRVRSSATIVDPTGGSHDLGYKILRGRLRTSNILIGTNLRF